MSINIRSIKGFIRRVNEDKIRNLKKYKIIRNRIVSLSLAALLFLTGLFIGKTGEKKAAERMAEKATISSMVKNQDLTNVTIKTEHGDSVSKIASKYYDFEFKGYFDTQREYEKAIMKENNMKSSRLDVGEDIELPVVVNKDDPNYLKMKEIENKIKDIEANNLWIRYKIQDGDYISKLAARASGTYEETYDITLKIFAKNRISKKTVLNIGDEIWIMNPELGNLKLELYEIEQDLANSLINNSKK